MPGNLKIKIEIDGERQFSRTLYGVVDRVRASRRSWWWYA